MQQPDAIIINGLEFYGYHGASDQEQTVGHRYVVTARLTVDTACSARTDLLSDTVSYSKVAKRIVEVGTQERFRLLESLAARIVSVVFEEFSAVSAILLRVEKICPPMNAIVASVGVEIARCRTHQPGNRE